MTQLRTFTVPESVQGNGSDLELAREMISAWQRDGIFQVATTATESRVVADAMDSSRRFFAQPMAEKAHLVSELTYSGYIASGEEVTAGEADFSEIFTVCKDVPADDARVRRLAVPRPGALAQPGVPAPDGRADGGVRLARRAAAAARGARPWRRSRGADPVHRRRLAPHARAALPAAHLRHRPGHRRAHRLRPAGHRRPGRRRRAVRAPARARRA